MYVVHSNNVRQSNNLRSCRSIGILVLIWFMAFFLSSPLFFFNRIESIIIKLDANVNDANYLLESVNDTLNYSMPVGSYASTTTAKNIIEGSLNEIVINHCIENSPFNQSRLIYSYASLLMQYVLPILIVGIAYGSIWWKLKTQRDKLKHHSEKFKSKLSNQR